MANPTQVDKAFMPSLTNWFWTYAVFHNLAEFLHISQQLCACVCPLIVTLDCSKTATYWDSVGTAVTQAAYVMRHVFSLSLTFPLHLSLPTLGEN